MKVKAFTTLLLAVILCTVFFSCEMATSGKPSSSQQILEYSFKVDLATDGNGSGTFIRARSAEDGSYQVGTTITVEASADSNCFFFGWYDKSSDGSLVSGEVKYSFTLKSDTELYARFDRNDITFTDPALEEVVRNKLANLTGKLTFEQVKQITKLDANSSSTTTPVANLNGIEYLTNLRELNLTMSDVSDLSPLADLQSLRILYLSGCKVADISPLAKLTNLSALMLNFNQIKDISVVKNMTNLRYLTVGDNMITDFSPITDLTNLVYLQIFKSNISDISFLSKLTKLESLEATYNSITDISVLIDMARRGFKGKVYLNGNTLDPIQVDTLRRGGVTVNYLAN